MFFNKHKKQGAEVGKAALETIVKKAFIGTQFYDDINFNPPEGMFNDKYIRGYFTNYIDLHIIFIFNGRNWDSRKKGEFLLEAFDKIDPSQTLSKNHLQMGRDISLALELRDDNSFKKGQEDSTTFVGTLFNKLRPDDPDPVLEKARKLAPKLAKENIALGLPSSENLDLATAVYMLTFYEYIKENWC